jgi:membrane protease YdiL (CAAX protease family)
MADDATGGATWGEVAAVLAVGVVPNLVGAITATYSTAAPLPYWLDAFHLAALSGCTIFVTLYLIRRSGVPAEQFGVVRPQLWDVSTGLLLMGAALVVSRVVALLPDDPSRRDLFPRPNGTTDLALAWAKYFTSAYAEELVTRAYLITRLTALLRSRGEAVVVSAIAFAAYHLYQGPVGVAGSFAFGVVYGVAFLALRRVWPLVIGHATYNLLIELSHP